jgi:hypothetical protein
VLAEDAIKSAIADFRKKQEGRGKAAETAIERPEAAAQRRRPTTGGTGEVEATPGPVAPQAE